MQGVVIDGCTPLSPAPNDATCNGADDDCDGLTDEDYTSTATSCVVAGCQATGTTNCVSGQVQDSCLTAPVCVAELVCQDGVDNDHDGAMDCFDLDCTSAANCAPQSFSMTIDGRANIGGAGHATPPVDGLLPPFVSVPFGGGAVVTFTSVTGSVVQNGAPLPPDGTPGAWTIPSVGGLGGFIDDTRARAMVGVFVGPTEPVNPAPPQLHFTSDEFTQLSPGLKQMFFIGDGKTATGQVQRFIVPSGATRLFIGGADQCASPGLGCFGDNSGSFQAQLVVSPR